MRFSDQAANDDASPEDFFYPSLILDILQFELFCDKHWWPSTSTSLFYVGSLFGNVMFGFIADK